MASFCAACGGALPDGANFCSVCGKAVHFPSPLRAGAMRLLVRPRVGRKIAGICLGLANQFLWDVTLTRVIAVVLGVLLFPISVIVYALCWFIIPEEASIVPSMTTLTPAP